MASLTDRELADIQMFVDQTSNHLGKLGLELGADEDLWKWKDLVECAPGSEAPSKTLDPEINDVRPGNSFWVHVTDNAGDIVACQAGRLIETDDFIREYVCTLRMFGDRKPVINHHPVNLVDGLPVIAGRLNFGGGTWVHPRWRSRGLSGIVSRLGRNLAMRHFLSDYYVGFIKASAKRRRYGKEQLGLMNSHPLLTGYYPGREGDLDVDFYWMHRDEMLTQIVEESSQQRESDDELRMRTA